MKEEEMLQLRNWFYRELPDGGPISGDRGECRAGSDPVPEPTPFERWERWLEITDR